MQAESPARSALEAIIARRPVLLSGAFGTELLRRGRPTPLPLWSTAPLLDDPAAVKALHADYLVAGARILTANTFRTDRRTLARAGVSVDARTLTQHAVALAREAVAEAGPPEPVFVAGSLAPLEDCYEPELVPDETTLRTEHGISVGRLVSARVDLVMIETMNTVREAVAALGATQAAAVPATVSFVCGPGGRLLSGEALEDAALAAAAFDPIAVMVNCCTPEAAAEALALLLATTEIPAGVYANGQGCPDARQGWRFEGGVDDETYVQHAERWLETGARLVGGCCGTSPSTIQMLDALIRSR